MLSTMFAKKLRNIQANAYLFHISFQNRQATAHILDYLLETWFLYESYVFPGEHYSLAIVDTMGMPPLNLDFMTHNILNAIFEGFGKPLILDYRHTLRNSMEVVFPSMTEALAASMFFGEWYRFEEKTDCFAFRVRIVPTYIEEIIIRVIGGEPSTAFEFSYFLRENYEKEHLHNKMVKTKLTKRILRSLLFLNFQSGIDLI